MVEKVGNFLENKIFGTFQVFSCNFLLKRIHCYLSPAQQKPVLVSVHILWYWTTAVFKHILASAACSWQYPWQDSECCGSRKPRGMVLSIGQTKVSAGARHGNPLSCLNHIFLQRRGEGREWVNTGTALSTLCLISLHLFQSAAVFPLASRAELTGLEGWEHPGWV